MFDSFFSFSTCSLLENLAGLFFLEVVPVFIQPHPFLGNMVFIHVRDCMRGERLFFFGY